MLHPGDNARAQDTSNEDAKGVKSIRTNGAEEEKEEEEDAKKERMPKEEEKHDEELDKGLRVAGEEVACHQPIIL